ncbi:MAG: HNH endonuclease [Rhodobacterales bacterium]|nr:HNH endonuclease [Rhodobacterales bacterium]
MDKFYRGDRPKHYGEPRHLRVVHPKSNKPYAIKGIWGLATTNTTKGHNSTEDARKLKNLGFKIVVVGLPSVLSPKGFERNSGLYEGAEIQVTSNKYERNPKARKACLKHYQIKDGSLRCQCCKVDFSQTYGEIGNGFIHIHHLTPISAKGGTGYEIDPVKDLIPLCPNCHAMVHRKNPPYSIENLVSFIKEQQHN